MYEAEFYKRLFSNSIPSNNYGVLVAAAKATRAPYCKDQRSSIRWVQYGLNPIGDPEMPIWTANPKKFGNIKFDLCGTGVNINTGIEGCKICITDAWDYGEGYFKCFEDVEAISVSDIPEECYVCVTKPGYIPRTVKVLVLQNKAIMSSRYFSDEVILCGSSVLSNIKEGPFDIKSGKTKLRGKLVVLGPGSKIELGGQLEINN